MPLQLVARENDKTPPRTDQPAPAEVVIGDVQFTDQDAKFINPPDPLSIWTDYRVSSNYHRDGHVYIMGVTSPSGFRGKKAAFVQLAEPTLLWVATWTACRWKERPEVPDPDTGDDNWVLMDDLWSPYQITVNAGGDVPLYRLSGVFVYGCLDPDPKVINQLSWPRPPWLEDVFERRGDQSLLTRNIISSAFGAAKKKASVGGG